LDNIKNFIHKFLKKNLKELLREVVQNLNILERNFNVKAKNAHLQNHQRNVKDQDQEDITKTNVTLKNQLILMNFLIN
jgi:spore coat protein CotF